MIHKVKMDIFFGYNTYTYTYIKVLRTIKSLSQIFPHVYKFIVFYKGCPIHMYTVHGL